MRSGSVIFLVSQMFLNRFAFSVYWLCCAVLLCDINAVWAQSSSQDFLKETPVFSRELADFKPRGINYGTFSVFTELGVTPAYDDNIFLEQNNTTSDFSVTLTPSIDLVKEYGDSFINIKGQGALKRYREEASENLDLYSFGLSGQHVINRDWSVLYDGSVARDVIDRKTPGDTRFTIAPTYKNNEVVELGIRKRFNRLNLTLLGSAKRTTFENGVSRQTGLPIILEGRNHNTRKAQLEVSYDVYGRQPSLPDHQFFGLVSYQDQKFNRSTLNPGDPVADSTEIGFLAGFNTRYKGILFGKLGLGFFRRDFKDSESVNAIDVDAIFAYNLTPKLTLNFSAARAIEEDNSLTSGFIETQTSAGFDYEILHNWYGGTAFTYKNQDFLGSQAGRDDDVMEAEIYMRYIHSPYFVSKLSASHNRKDSSVSGADYDQNIFMYSLTGRL